MTVTFEQLARSINLRDLGGIAASDGRTVKPGMLFRSAAFGDLTEPERQALTRLGIHSIVDLRDNSERAEHPTPWEDFGCRRYLARDYGPTGGGNLSSLLSDETMSRDAAHQFMVRVYDTLVFRHVEALQQLFQAVASGEGPILFHCTSGKDRTGISAALILSALGAPREAIMADYLASLSFDILASPAFRDLTPEARERFRPIFSVHRDYLEAMFSAIEQGHGSVDRFLLDSLEVQPATVTRLRETLLE